MTVVTVAFDERAEATNLALTEVVVTIDDGAAVTEETITDEGT